jgi:hypothetical protein
MLGGADWQVLGRDLAKPTFTLTRVAEISLISEGQFYYDGASNSPISGNGLAKN